MKLLTLNNMPLESSLDVTIIMPIYNEEAFIARSLQAVLEQDYPVEHLEILVVDGMSTDGTREIVSALQSQCSNVKLLDNPGRIVSTALNIGLRHVQGNIVILVGGHCEIAPDYVAQCARYLQAHQDVAVVGGALETIGETPIAQAIAVAMSSSFGVGGVTFRTGSEQEALVDTVAFGAYRREIVDAAGLFDEELVRNQDDEYNYRIRKMGGKIYFVPTIKARYYSRGNLRSLWRQYFQYGFWKVRVLQKHPFQMHIRQFVPAIFVSALIASVLWAAFSTTGIVLFALVVGVYLWANLLASLSAAIKRGWRYLAFLPIVFSTLHFSYGFGFICGLWRWRNRWQREEFVL